MYYKTKVKIPENNGKISIKKSSNTSYVEYAFYRKYDAKKGYTVSKKTTIGKVCPDDDKMMYPNPKFEQYFPLESIPDEDNPKRALALDVGSYIVLKKLIEDYELQKHLASWDERDRGLILDLAIYSIITESNAMQHYPSYAFTHPLMTPGHRIYSDSTISRFLSEMKQDQRILFLNSWNKDFNKKDRIYVSYDSTNKNCKAGEIEMAEYGHPKNDVGAPIVNYSLAYDLNNKIPLLYESYPGSLTDVTQLQALIDKFNNYGYKNLGFVLDRGYFSRTNLDYMRKYGYEYIIMVKGKYQYIRTIIDEVKGSFEKKIANFIREYDTYGTTVCGKLYKEDEKDSYFHLYYKLNKDEAESTVITRDMNKMEDEMNTHLNKDWIMPIEYEKYYIPLYDINSNRCVFLGFKRKDNVIEEALKYSGYFAIVTSNKMTAAEALRLYKNRDISEKLFCSDKSFLGNNSFRVSTTASMESKIFIEFIALIIRSKLYSLLKDRMKEMSNSPNYMTVPGAIEELEKIKLYKYGDGPYKLPFGLTATQKTILGAVGISKDEFIERAISLSNEFEKLDKEDSDDNE